MEMTNYSQAGIIVLVGNCLGHQGTDIRLDYMFTLKAQKGFILITACQSSEVQQVPFWCKRGVRLTSTIFRKIIEPPRQKEKQPEKQKMFVWKDISHVVATNEPT